MVSVGTLLAASMLEATSEYVVQYNSNKILARMS